MGKDKNKPKNIEEEKKMGETSLRKLIEVYSYNTVVDQFFMRTSKKIVEIDKILRNLKNKAGSAFVSRFLYENKSELSSLCKGTPSANGESSSILGGVFANKFLNKKRNEPNEKNIKKILEKKKKSSYDFNTKTKKKTYNLQLRNSNVNNLTEKEKKGTKSNKKMICIYLLINSYSKYDSLKYKMNKTIDERASSMRKKILTIFPEIDKSKAREVHNFEDNKKKEMKEPILMNDSHETKESELNFN